MQPCNPKRHMLHNVLQPGAPKNPSFHIHSFSQLSTFICAREARDPSRSAPERWKLHGTDVTPLQGKGLAIIPSGRGAGVSRRYSIGINMNAKTYSQSMQAVFTKFSSRSKFSRNRSNISGYLRIPPILNWYGNWPSSKRGEHWAGTYVLNY